VPIPFGYSSIEMVSGVGIEPTMSLLGIRVYSPV